MEHVSFIEPPERYLRLTVILLIVLFDMVVRLSLVSHTRICHGEGEWSGGEGGGGEGRGGRGRGGEGGRGGGGMKTCLLALQAKLVQSDITSKVTVKGCLSVQDTVSCPSYIEPCTALHLN